MRVIDFEQKRIYAIHIERLMTNNPPPWWWSFRSVKISDGTDFSGESGPREMLQEFAANIGPFVESLEICVVFGGSNFTLEAIRSGLAPTRSPRLKKLHFTTLPIGDDSLFLSALQMTTSLEKLAVSGAVFTSPNNVEHFLATTQTLTTLELDTVVCTEEVATAFRQGLRHNQSITQVYLRGTDRGPADIKPEILFGVLENKHVQELKLEFEWDRRTYYTMYMRISNETLAAIRAAVSGTKSIRKLALRGPCEPLVEMFHGLAANSSVEEIEISFTNLGGLGTVDYHRDGGVLDQSLANAINEFSAQNATVQVCEVVGSKHGETHKFGPRSREAFTRALTRMPSLRKVKANAWCASPNVLLPHITKFQSVSLPELAFRDILPDWRLLVQAVEHHQGEHVLQVLDLSDNMFTAQSLQTFLPGLPHSLLELVLRDCGVAAGSVPFICDFIRTAQVKKLNLGFNRFGAGGAGPIFDAVSDSTVEYLTMDGPIDLNDCHESLGTMIAASRLKSVDLTQYDQLNRDCIRSLAAGLRRTETLETIKVPWLNLEFIRFLGEALTVNRSVESIHVEKVVDRDDEGRRVYFPVLGAAEEKSVLSFIQKLPQMKHLKSIKGLFDFYPTDQICEELVAALNLNTTLKEIGVGFVPVDDDQVDHFCKNNSEVQFYLQLNRLGRHNFVAAPEDNPVPVGALPDFYARMTGGPEYTSHLYYFLRHTSPDRLGPKQDERAAN